MHNSLGIWTTKPCLAYRLDKVTRHRNSAMHKDAVAMEASHATTKRHGGIEASFQRTVTLQKQAVMGGMKCMYWLVKEEVAKFASLLNLVLDLGCSYLKALNQGENAHYTSERIMNEFVQALSKITLKGKLLQVLISVYFVMNLLMYLQ